MKHLLCWLNIHYVPQERHKGTGIWLWSTSKNVRTKDPKPYCIICNKNNTMTTHNTREWETRFNEQYTSMAYGERWRPGMEFTPSMIKSFIHQELQKAREEAVSKERGRIEIELMSTESHSHPGENGLFKAWHDIRKVINKDI